MTEPAPTPRLVWSIRPRRLACACGRKPLLGYLDEDGATFLGACCYDDGLPASLPVRSPILAPFLNHRPRLRTPEEREKIVQRR